MFSFFGENLPLGTPSTHIHSWNQDACHWWRRLWYFTLKNFHSFSKFKEIYLWIVELTFTHTHTWTDYSSRLGDIWPKRVEFLVNKNLLIRTCRCYILIFPPTHSSPRKNEYILVFPLERSVYTHFSPRKDQYILIFPPDF